MSEWRDGITDDDLSMSSVMHDDQVDTSPPSLARPCRKKERAAFPLRAQVRSLACLVSGPALLAHVAKAKDNMARAMQRPIRTRVGARVLGFVSRTASIFERAVMTTTMHRRAARR